VTSQKQRAGSRFRQRTIEKTGHSAHQLTRPHKHTNFTNATAVSLVPVYEQFYSADGVWLKRLCDVASTDNITAPGYLNLTGHCRTENKQTTLQGGHCRSGK